MWKSILKIGEKLGKKIEKNITSVFYTHSKISIPTLLFKIFKEGFILQSIFSYPHINTPNSSNKFYI